MRQIKRPDSERCRVVPISVKANIAIPADSLKSEHHSKDRCHCQNQKQHAAKKDVQIVRYEFCSHKNFLFCKIIIFCMLCTFPRTQNNVFNLAHFLENARSICFFFFPFLHQRSQPFQQPPLQPQEKRAFFAVFQSNLLTFFQCPLKILLNPRDFLHLI